MDDITRCKIHKNHIKALCMSCNTLICHNCLSLHADKGCKYPIGLPVYAELHLLPKVKAQLEGIEGKKSAMEESLRVFQKDFLVIREGLERLKVKLEAILKDVNEGIEKIDGSVDKLVSPYENIRKMMIKSCKEIEYAIAKEDMGYIIKKLHDSRAVDLLEVNESEKLLVDAIDKAIVTLLDLQEFDTLEEGLNELFIKTQAYFTELDTEIPEQNVYGICELQAECTKLCQFNIQTKKLLPSISIPKWSTIAQVAGKVFISGGYNPVVNTLYEFKELTKTLSIKQPMKHPKYDHKVEGVLGNEFITIGGHNGLSSIAHCESYSILQNKWKTLPSLNKARHNPATCLLNDRYVYAIGGCNTNGEIEVLDLIEKSVWKVLVLEVSEMVLNGSPAAFQVSDKEIVILRDGSDETGILNVEKNTLVKHKEGLKSDYYYCNPVCLLGRKAYTLGATRGNLVIYDITQQLFTILNYSEIYS